MSDWRASLKGKIKRILKKIGITQAPVRTQGANEIVDLVKEVVEEEAVSAGVLQTDTHEVDVDGESVEVPFIAFFPPGDGRKPGYYFFDVVGRRNPEKHENYLVGDEAVLARHNVRDEHLVVERTHHARKHNIWRKDAKVEKNS